MRALWAPIASNDILDTIAVSFYTTAWFDHLLDPHVRSLFSAKLQSGHMQVSGCAIAGVVK